MFIFYGCSKEEVNDPLPVAEEVIEKNGVRFVDESSIPFLKQDINKFLSGTGNLEKSTEDFSLNRKNIMEVMDEDGNKTFDLGTLLLAIKSVN